MHTIFENTRSIIANALIIILKKKKKTSKSLFMLDIFNCIQRNINFHKRKQSSSSFQLLHKHKKKKKKKKDRIIFPLPLLSFVPFIPQYWNFLHRPISLWSRKKEGALLEDYQPSQNSRVHHSRWPFYTETWSSFGNS